jgi:RHS repeat-associated protein
MQYNYSTTQNNGQITQAVDAVSGETVDYAYDSLNRLISAATTGPQWGLSFGYDGFGNRLNQTVTKGSAPSNSVSVNASTNRISSSGYVYDLNGNLTTMPYGAGSMTLTYDVENRVIQAVNSNGTEQYGYSPDNRRVYRKLPSGAGGSQLIYFYGANGDRLATYNYFGNGVFQVFKSNLYFGGRMIRQNNTATFIDRLGSDRNGTRYYPYGEEYSATGNDKNKFATYFRDSSTGLDYALNRYYGSTMGRFLTPDPFGGSAKLPIPQTWNRYAYVANDPVNLTDRLGLDPYDNPDIGFSATFMGWMAVWMASVAGPGFQGMGSEGPTFSYPLLTPLLGLLGNPVGGTEGGGGKSLKFDDQGREIMDASEWECARGILQAWFDSPGYSQELSKVVIAYAQGNELMQMQKEGAVGKSIALNRIVFVRQDFNPSAAKTQTGIGHLAHELTHNMQRILNPNYDAAYALEHEYWKAQGLTGVELHDANRFERAARAKETEVLADLKKHFGDKNPCP